MHLIIFHLKTCCFKYLFYGYQVSSFWKASRNWIIRQDLYVLSSVLWCPFFDFRIKTKVGSSLPPVVCRRVHFLFTLFVFVCVVESGVKPHKHNLHTHCIVKHFALFSTFSIRVVSICNSALFSVRFMSLFSITMFSRRIVLYFSFSNKNTYI
jgi:hypothetical protein